MKCKIIVVKDDQKGFEKQINDFIKDKAVNNVSVSSTKYIAGYTPYTQFVACVTYTE